MKKLITAVLAFCALAIAGVAFLPMPGVYITQTEVKEIKATEPAPSPSSSPKGGEVHILPFPYEAPSKADNLDVIQLGSKNSLVLRGVIMEESVASIQKKLLDMSASLSPSDTIYLVLDSPGGSVPDGQQLIDTIQGLPQKVKTISIFAASMAFQIVQNLDERMVTPSGTLMSHRAKIGGMAGEIGSDGKGELFSELNWLIEGLKKLDHQAASRMQMSDSAYLDLIRDEYWVSGTKALKDHAADRVVLLRCNKDLIEGSDTIMLRTIFGNVRLEFSRCPMIQAPVRVDFMGQKNKDLKKFVSALTGDKQYFVRQYVMTGELDKIIQ